MGTSPPPLPKIDSVVTEVEPEPAIFQILLKYSSYFDSLYLITDPFCLTECEYGYYEIDGNCEECPLGHYKPTIGPENCTRCPDGQSTDQTGSTSLSNCCMLHFFNCFDISSLRFIAAQLKVYFYSV